MITIIQKNLRMLQKMCTFAVPKEEICNVATLHPMATSYMFIIAISYSPNAPRGFYLQEWVEVSKVAELTSMVSKAKKFDNYSDAFDFAIMYNQQQHFENRAVCLDLDEFLEALHF